MAKDFDQHFKDSIPRMIYEAEGDAPAEEDPLAALNPPEAPAAPAAPGPDQAAAEDIVFGDQPEEPAAPAAPGTEAPVETPDDKIIPYEKKVENMIAFLKQLGYAKVDHKIDEAKNSIVVIGEISPEEEAMVNELAADQHVKVKIRKDAVGNSTVTRINVENIIDIPTFKELLAKEEKEKGTAPAV